MSKRAPRERRTSAVLHLSHEWAEWAGPAGPGRVAPVTTGRAPVLGLGVEDLADAAVRAREASGARPTPCVLALAGTLIEQRLLKLPPLPGADLRRVCHRKAAALLDAEPKETLFVALPMEVEQGSAAPHDAGQGDAGQADASRGEGEELGLERRWLLVAQHRARAVELRLALRRRGIAVQRVTVARLARLARAQEVRGALRPACVVIDVEQRTVDLGLIADRALAHQSHLEGDLAANPAMTLAVVQELRGLDAHWRRTHRGGGVAQVLLIGLDPDRALPVLQAIDATLPEADVAALPDVPELGAVDPEASVGSGRAESLLACRALGPFSVDLTVHVPAPHACVLSLAACLLVVGGGLGSLLYGRLTARLGDLEGRARAMTFQARDLEQVTEENARAEGAVAALAAELERIAAADRRGLPLERTLSAALRAFGPGTALLSLSVDPAEAGGAVQLGGVTGPDPLAAMQRLGAVGAALEASPEFTAVEVEPPVALGPESDLLAFAVRARRAAQGEPRAPLERTP